ncbi:MAG TPA: DUF4129 domain-containing protein [Rectinemataceae bacterium]
MITLLAAAGAMEAAKMELAASYLWLVFGRSPPYMAIALASIFPLALGASVRRKGGKRGLRRWVPFLVQSAGLCALAAATLPWGSDTPGFVLFASTLAAAWLRGAWLEHRMAAGGAREFLCIRFDEGMVLFLLAFIFSSILGAQNPAARPLGSAFLSFSILALGLAKRLAPPAARPSAQTDTKPQGFAPSSEASRLFGTAAGFALAALGLFKLIPLFQAPARRTAQALGEAGRGFLGLVECLILWLFKPGRARMARDLTESGALRQGQEPLAAEQSASPFSTIMMYILLGAAAAAILALLAYLVFILVRYLSGRTAPSPGSAEDSGSLLARLAAFLKRLSLAVKKACARLARAFFGPTAGKSPARMAFSRLLACGRAAGTPRRPTETAREFGTRLSECFPAKAASVEVVRAAFEEELYGGRVAGYEGASEALKKKYDELEKAKAALAPIQFFLGAVLGTARRKEVSK